MVKAQHLLVTEAFGIRHLRLILGNSMGGMHTWLWGVTYPGFSDALVPMASQPTAMAGRNWMTRRLLIEMIRRDPAYHGGNYTVQPPSLALANAFFATATNGGTLAYQVRTRCESYLGTNLKRRSSSSAAPIQTIQPTGDRQNTRLLFSCWTNRHPVAFTKLFTRTDKSSRNIRCPIRFML